jgi:hypothetical protein
MTTTFARIGCGAAFALALASPALAQTYHDTGGTTVPGVVVVDPTDNTGPLFTSTNPGKVAGTFSATLSGFAPTPAYSQLNVGPSSARVGLPSGTAVVVYNTGSYAAYVTLGNSSVTATTSDDVIQPNSWMAFTVGSNTYLAAIETAGATALNISGGSGLPTGAGVGSGGSVPTGSAGSPNASVVSVQGISGGTGVPVTGTFWQTTQPVSGTFWQATQPVSLASLPALAAGSNTIGAVTQASGPWTFNWTQLNGTALGSPSNYGTSPGAVEVQGVNAYVTNTVPVSGTFWQTTQPVSLASLPALAAGSNTIGAVTQASGPWTVNWTQLDGATLGAPSNYGTSPGAVAVQGVNAYVTNTVPVSGTFWQTTQPVSLASLPALASGSNTIGAVTQASGPWSQNVTQIAGSASGVTTWGTAPTGASVLNANVNCLSGCGGSGGTSASDNSTFTAGSSSFTPMGGEVGGSALTSGHMGAVAMDTGRNLFVNNTEWAGSALGAPSNYGTSPGAVAVPGVNAYVTNTVPVSGTFWQATQPVSLASLPAYAATPTFAPQDGLNLCSGGCSLSAAGTFFTQDTTGYQSISLEVNSNSGGNTISFQASDDDVNWVSAGGLPSNASGSSALSYSTATTTPTLYRIPVFGRYFRATLSTYVSGSTTIYAYLHATPATVSLTQPVLAASSAVIGKVDVLGNSGATLDTAAGTSATQALGIQGVTGGVAVPVSGTFWQTTQPVSLASLPALASGSNTIGAVTQASGPWTINQTQLAGTALGAPSNYGTSPGAVEVQGVNAYVTASALPTGAATSANQPTNAAQGGSLGSDTGNLHFGSVVSANPSYSAGTVQPETIDSTTGGLRVDVVAGGGSGGTSSSYAASFPATGTAAGGEYLSSTPTYSTSGQMQPFLVSSSGNLLIDAPSGSNLATLLGQGNYTGSATAFGYYVAQGGRAQSSEPTAGTTGDAVSDARDLTGKTITSPYANRENYARGSASSTGTTATTLLAAAGSGIKNYVTDIECGRTDTGTSAIYVTFSDSASTIFVLPDSGGGGGNDKSFNVPLATAANTAFTFTSSAATSTVYCSAQGYTGY